ncbi:MAG: transposase [Calditrichia bacterium]
MISGVQRQKERSRKNRYSESFKIKVVKEVEKGLLTKEEARRKYGINGKSMVLYWRRQYGIGDYKVKKKDRTKNYTPDEKDKKIAELEARLTHEKFKVDALEALIEVANEMYGTDLKKKVGTKRLRK